MKLTKIIETCIYSEDLPQTKTFYQEILGLHLHSESEGRHLFFRCGNSMLMIFHPEETLKPKFDVPTHGARGPGHVAFSVPESEFHNWPDYLKTKGISIEKQIDWPGGGKSIYFRDPANNSVELTTPSIWNLD
jgi:catechol 2,3-dioxygenase-like lactoylglutathione lyase family enzyme